MKTKLWIARDKDGSLFLYDMKPIKKTEQGWFCTNIESREFMGIDRNSHPEITWENSPQEIEI